MSFVSSASSGRPLTRLSRASSISSSSYSSTSCAAAESTSGFNFNETSFAINDVLTVTTNAQFFADTTIAVEKDRESRSRHAALKNRKAKSNGSNLNSIDEDKEIDNDDIVKEKKVKLTSLIIPHGGNNCARYVSKNLHQAITEHPNFTSLVKMPEVFRDAFVQIDELFMNTEEANDDSGCSVICAIITPSNGICVAHVGEARGIIRGTDGTISELTSPHVIESSSKEKTRLKKNGAFISSDNKLFGKLSYSRSFGHKYLKQEFPGSLICLPNVIQIQMNINTETSPITRSISTSSERSSRNLKSQKKDTRNDVLMVLGSSTIWKNLNDKKMCSSLTASLFNGSSLTEAVSSMISLRKSNPLMFWRERDTSMDQNVPKGLYVVNWVSYSAA